MNDTTTLDGLSTSGAGEANGYWTRLVATDHGIAGPILRLTLALVMFPHGAQKALGWFGGHGFGGSLQFLTGAVGLPAIVALLVIAAEFLGPIGLAAGLLTRVAALGIGSVMIGAIATGHWQNGFFMNWSGAQGGEGFEYHLLAIGISLALIVTGGGRWSLDGWLARGRAR